VVASLFISLSLGAGISVAGEGDCGQPLTGGISPVATDCLFLLNTSVGLTSCTYDCLCDVDASGSIVATDSLACLNRAVGAPGPLTCACETPELVGLDPTKSLVLPVTVQTAYNDDTMFFHISWEGDRGDTHDYLHFTGGQWQREGWPRRDAQATIDNDPLRGPTNATSTIYESRVTWMVDDPTGPNAVAGFGEYGCYKTCHDNSRAMPEWDPSTDLTKYLNDGEAGSLDLWHHRLHRANPIGASDDQFVSTVPPGGEAGGRVRDTGTSVWQTNGLDQDGNPTYVIDPSTSNGLFAIDYAALFTDPARMFQNPGTALLGPGPVVDGYDYATAVMEGYVAQEGDTVPRRRLRTPDGSAGDITSFGTTFTPSAGDPLFGRWDSNTQRLLDTGNADDTALAVGGVYNVGFAVHTGKVTVRDHYVSFPQTLSIGGAGGDIDAVQIAGSGTGTLPDFTDTVTYPPAAINFFLPGIASLEFVNGENTGLVYVDPVNDLPVDQNHAGSTALLTQGLGCRDCHTVADSDPFEPVNGGGFNGGSMETLVPQRGGVNTQTPIPPAGS
jgi:hypothetical protein